MIDRVNQEFGQIDILVNNAGWSTRIPHDQLDNLTDEIWDRTFDTNLKGAFYAVRSAVPSLRKQPGSSIVNVASVAGITGMGSSIAYAASKGAMITMSKSLARALAPDIRVNAIAPGFVRTRFANWPAVGVRPRRGHHPAEASSHSGRNRRPSAVPGSRCRLPPPARRLWWMVA